jgi:hypothetical protein
MIDRQAYAQMQDLANTKFENMRASIPQDVDVIFVVSVDVYQAMLVYDNNPLRRDADEYRGVRLGVINECEATEFFQPVIYSRNYHHYGRYVEPGDFVVFNDENYDRVFSLARVNPGVVYEDTGYTVTFSPPTIILESSVAQNAIQNTIANLVDPNMVHLRNVTLNGIFDVEIEPGEQNNTVQVDTDQVSDWGEPANHIQYTQPIISANMSSNSTHINENLFKRLTGMANESFGVRLKRKEADLNPGNTKLLDEYLSGFKKKN